MREEWLEMPLRARGAAGDNGVSRLGLASLRLRSGQALVRDDTRRSKDRLPLRGYWIPSSFLLRP